MPVIARRAAGASIAALAALSAGGAGLLAAAGPASADVFYNVVVRADGMRVTGEGGANVPLGIQPTVAVPETAVTLRPTQSTGYASAPYPGAAVIGALGLAGGTAGVPVPAYPALVTSSYPSQPTGDMEAPAYSIKAESKESSSTADGSIGLTQPGVGNAGTSNAHAAADAADDGTVTAQASAQLIGMDLGLLRLGRVSATAKMVRSPDGQITRTSDLFIEGASVAGQSVTITPAGIVAAGQSAPLPDTAPAASILQSAGISVHYLPERRTDATSLVGTGFEIDVVQDTPNGKVTTTYVIGQAFLAIDASGSPDGAGGGTTGGATGEFTGSTSDFGATGSLGGTTTGLVSGPVIQPPSVGPAPEPGAGTAPGQPVVPQAATSPLFQQLSDAAWYWYLALVGAAAAVLLAGQMVRVLGVRIPTRVEA